MIANFGSIMSAITSLTMNDRSSEHSDDLIQYKRLRSSQKPPQESIRRCPTSSLTSIAKNASFDSLNQALQDLDETMQMDSRTTVPPTFHSNPDPESQYTASQTTHKENDNNAHSSPDLHRKRTELYRRYAPGLRIQQCLIH
jgi:hypothetical protein